MAVWILECRSAYQADSSAEMTASELTTAFGKLETKLDFYAGVFKWAMGTIFTLVLACAAVLWNMHGSLSRVEVGQANTTSGIVAALLKKLPQEAPTDKAEVVQILNAATTLLRTSRLGEVRPTRAAIQSISTELFEAQTRYRGQFGARLARERGHQIERHDGLTAHPLLKHANASRGNHEGSLHGGMQGRRCLIPT